MRYNIKYTDFAPFLIKFMSTRIDKWQVIYGLHSVQTFCAIVVWRITVNHSGCVHRNDGGGRKTCWLTDVLVILGMIELSCCQQPQDLPGFNYTNNVSIYTFLYFKKISKYRVSTDLTLTKVTKTTKPNKTLWRPTTTTHISFLSTTANGPAELTMKS